jgi:leader peptidase (prepilin peptidase)/N-methyltransferase
MTSPLPALLHPVLLTATLAALGLPAGAIARRLLARLRRGARVHPPWCELGVAVAWALSGVATSTGALAWRWLPVLLGLGWLAVAAGTVDLIHHRLPDALTLPALPLALLLLAPVGAEAVLRGLAGAGAAVAAYAALHLVAPAAMGAGDVKLAAPLGAVLAAASWPALALGAAVAALLSGGSAVVLLGCGDHAAVVRGGRARRALAGRCGLRRVALPHGPSMLVATWLVATVTAGAGARGP